jgi:rhamnosyltransferase subunit B
MQVLVVRWGSSGDVLPYVAIGAEMRRRGHDVTFIGNPHYETQATGAGLAFQPVGSVADHERLMADPDVFGGARKAAERVYADHYYPHLEAYYETTAARVRGAAARTVVIGGEVGSAIAAERHDAPLVYVACSPAMSRYTQSRFDPPHPQRVLPRALRWFTRTGPRLSALYRLNALRRGPWRTGSRVAASAPPVDHPIARLRTSAGLPLNSPFAPRLVLCLWPDWFAAPQADWPSSAVTTGFLFFPAPEGGVAREPRGDDRGPIVFTTGSLAGSQRRFYRNAVDACEQLQRPGVLVTPHRDQIPERLPESVRYLAFAPFADLFAHASLVVHHGGIGTAAYALAAGIPQIAMPRWGDQFDNASRLERLGVSRTLSETASARDVAAAIRVMSGRESVRDRCHRFRRRIDPAAALAVAGNAIDESMHLRAAG